MATSHDLDPPARRPSRWRYLFLWPVYLAFLTWARRRLRRHLAISHLGTVYISVIATAVVAAVALATMAYVHRPVQQEPAVEARAVAGMLQDLNLAANPAATQSSNLLQLLA